MTRGPEEPPAFRRAVASLSAIHPRSEIELIRVRAPQRLAPWSFALAAEGNSPTGESIIGRLVLLHDPQSVQAWNGMFRLVVYAQAELDPELANDPLLTEVGWSWLTDALDSHGTEYTALGGTLTQTTSTRFGEIAGPTRKDNLELRASWTAPGPELTTHGEAFYALLASLAGLPPVGVTLFGQRSGGSSG